MSHSGGTFAPLAVSNLLQASTQDIFVVASEWDTQIGKQLRGLGPEKGFAFDSRIFVTDIGVRPAEPCTLSVVATHQLLTQIFTHLCHRVSQSAELRKVAGTSVYVNKATLEELERCNRDAIGALELVVGVDREGIPLAKGADRATHDALVARGVAWAQHVLEGPRVWALGALYVVLTVTLGAPLVTWATTRGAGGASALDGWPIYACRFVDALVYVWLGEILTAALRVCQRRPLWHRMGGRTVVIGDVPWVAQSAEAFLSKLFACSYAMAGLSVFSGNPADHLVHRFTHRVVRGALLAIGRPDGRLSALTSAEGAACLSANQASSIQSIGVTCARERPRRARARPPTGTKLRPRLPLERSPSIRCETVTLGHNPAALPLAAASVTLPGNRPRFLCEQVLAEELQNRGELARGREPTTALPPMSCGALLGEYMSLRTGAAQAGAVAGEHVRPPNLVDLIEQFSEGANPEMRRRKQWRASFDEIDADGGGTLDLDEFTAAFKLANAKAAEKQARHEAGMDDTRGSSMDGSQHGGGHQPELSDEQIATLFRGADVKGAGELDFDAFVELMESGAATLLAKLASPSQEESMWLEPSNEAYFGADLRATAPPGAAPFDLVDSQTIAMRLYESRIASLERAVAFYVMFHAMGKAVADWWPRWTFGLFKYRIDRTHSIMRIATTASPVSGADVRDRMREMARHKQFSTALFGIGKVSGAARGALKRLRANGHGVNFFKRAMMRSPSIKKVHRSFEDFQKLVDPKVGMSISDSDSSSNESNGVARARRESAPRRVDPPVAANGMNIEMIVEDRESYGPSFEGLPSCSCNAASEMLF